MSRPISKETARLHGYSDAAIRRGAVASRSDEDENLLDAGRPEPPPHLTDAEKTVWDSALNLLERRGTLTPGDGPALAMFALTSVELRNERTQLEREGRVVTSSRVNKHGHEILIREVNPRTRIVRDLERQFVTILRELGLTPLRRHGVKSTRNNNPLTPGKKALRDSELLFANTSKEAN
jgi:P27 family predicted phage terminase small subunit